MFIEQLLLFQAQFSMNTAVNKSDKKHGTHKITDFKDIFFTG